MSSLSPPSAGDDAVTEGVTDLVRGPSAQPSRPCLNTDWEKSLRCSGRLPPLAVLEEVSVWTPWSWWGGDLLSWTLWL